MRRVEQMLLELNAAWNGEPWYGTALRTMLEGIDEKTAWRRPIAEGHTIAELTAHVATWIDVVRERLAGEKPEVPPERDFPPVDGLTWPQLLARLQRAHSALVDAVARMDDTDFDKIVPGKDYTAAFMLDGLIQHNVYHAGQIALLRK
jgi:uncharacterized damage-inducible protein DinB